MCELTFLGTGGGRFMFLTQKRHSGGIWIKIGGLNFLLDPGPGSLIRCIESGLNPGVLDCVLASHRHLDHYNDVEVMVEGMTHGLRKKGGTLIIERQTEPYVSSYHKAAVNTIIPRPGDKMMVGDVIVKAIPTVNHANGLGFTFEKDKKIVYSGDSAYSNDVTANYLGADVLILNTIFGFNRVSDTHLNLADAERIAGQCRPKKMILTHFGVQASNEDPWKAAREISAKTGVDVVAAKDGMKILV
jgi:ribonuclease BN (tRNA processing enzyme)